MTMRAHLKFIVLLLLPQIIGMQGSVSDDEESMFDGSGSGSGSGCFEVTAVPGLCDCTVLYDCLETSSRSQCESTLGDCFTRFDGTGGCDGETNSTNISNKPPNGETKSTNTLNKPPNNLHDSAIVSQTSWFVVAVSALAALVGLL
ncbi:uncharacterized protein LOC128188507 isoform X1 [Crassostrea angulata]|uniref:uncharacterized protein LOC128188507 isoform X1 n=1 Tax=Magallana angulata TaxID=2784310 RepID=UPI0022B1011B|nr:uncharacterized protein LOC128188507 isoform X1 [Crassostrea angulata]